jgi:23S rRNA (cytosine1962-C5)-methyltransferase
LLAYVHISADDQLMAGIVVRPRARIFHGHDWVFNTEVLKVFGDPEPGSIISLKDGRDRMLGSAIYNPRSQIVARRFSRRREKLDLEFFVRRIGQAHEVRRQWTLGRDPGRLVWSESDGLPGLIVDRYDGHFVIQTLTLAMDQRKELIVQALDTLFSPISVIERNDAPVRRAEGLELTTGVLKGEVPPRLNMSIAGMDFELELLSGQKTGFYLDQIDSYREVGLLAPGKRVLDCFANQGAFAIACAKNGAASVTAVEISEPLAAGIEANARLNQVSLSVHAENAFDFLARQAARQETYDLIILDPPSFTRSRETLESARRGYKEIHLRALQLLVPQGLLVTFSCSHHITQAALLDIVVDASVDANRHLRRLKFLSQPLDHPILPHLPETEYLKGFIFQLLPGR